jgi:hypothetical protein
MEFAPGRKRSKNATDTVDRNAAATSAYGARHVLNYDNR